MGFITGRYRLGVTVRCSRSNLPDAPVARPHTGSDRTSKFEAVTVLAIQYIPA